MSNGAEHSSNGSGNSPVSDQGMTLEQVVRMGEEASRLLNSPLYQLAHRIAIDQALAEWSTTSPKEREKRESLWHEVQAHGRAADVMKGCIERAQQIMADQQQGQSDSGYFDTQGFGIGDSPNYQ